MLEFHNSNKQKFANSLIFRDFQRKKVQKKLSFVKNLYYFSMMKVNA